MEAMSLFVAWWVASLLTGAASTRADLWSSPVPPQVRAFVADDCRGFPATFGYVRAAGDLLCEMDGYGVRCYRSLNDLLYERDTVAEYHYGDFHAFRDWCFCWNTPSQAPFYPPLPEWTAVVRKGDDLLGGASSAAGPMLLVVENSGTHAARWIERGRAHDYPLPLATVTPFRQYHHGEWTDRQREYPGLSYDPRVTDGCLVRPLDEGFLAYNYPRDILFIVRKNGMVPAQLEKRLQLSPRSSATPEIADTMMCTDGVRLFLGLHGRRKETLIIVHCLVSDLSVPGTPLICDELLRIKIPGFRHDSCGSMEVFGGELIISTADRITVLRPHHQKTSALVRKQ